MKVRNYVSLLMAALSLVLAGQACSSEAAPGPGGGGSSACECNQDAECGNLCEGWQCVDCLCLVVTDPCADPASSCFTHDCQLLGGSTQCNPVPHHDRCPPGTSCNGMGKAGGIDGCGSGGTEPGNCADGLECTIDTRDPETGACVHTPNNGACGVGPNGCNAVCAPQYGPGYDGRGCHQSCLEGGACECAGYVCGSDVFCGQNNICGSTMPVECTAAADCAVAAYVGVPPDCTCVVTAIDANCEDDGDPCNGTAYCDETAGCKQTGGLSCPSGYSCVTGCGCLHPCINGLCPGSTLSCIDGYCRCTTHGQCPNGFCNDCGMCE